MLNGIYINGFRKLMGKVTVRDALFPSPSLGIEGNGQTFEAINVGAKFKVPKPTIKVKQIKTVEDKLHSSTGQLYNKEDFPKTGYIGEGT